MDLSWTERAACAGLSDPDLFFPDGLKGPRIMRQLESAKLICRCCEVRDECLRFALAIQPSVGVWAGLEPLELRDLVRRLQLPEARRRYLPPATGPVDAAFNSVAQDVEVAAPARVDVAAFGASN